MALRRLVVSGVAPATLVLAVAGVGTAAPAERAGVSTKAPTRLWYKLELRYRLSTKTTSESYGIRTESERNLLLFFGSNEAVLLRKGDGGLGFLSNGMGSGTYVDTMQHTTYGKPAECPPSVGIRHTRAFGPGLASIARNGLSFRWVGTRGEVVGNTTTSYLEPDRAGGPPQCKTIEGSWTRQNPFPQHQLPWLDLPQSAARSFGRRSIRISVRRAVPGGEWTLTVVLDRCPGTAPCAGEPPKPPPGLPPPPD